MLSTWVTNGCCRRLRSLPGVTAADVIAALLDGEQRWVQRVTVNGVDALVVCARTPAGVPIAVLLRPLGGFDHQIVAVQPLPSDQLAAFEEWERNR